MLSRQKVLMIAAGILMSGVIENFAFAQNVTPQREPTPIRGDLTSIQTDIPVPPEIRAVRGQIFARHFRNARPLTSVSPNTPPPVMHILRQSLSELPVAEADTIVVGDVLSITSHMLPDAKGIYTEYRVRAQEIMKAPPKVAASGLSKSLDIVEHGGAVQTSEGKVYRVESNGMGSSIEKSQYLFFLRYVPPGDCFRIVKFWDLHAGKAVPTAEDDKERVQRGISTVNNTDSKALLDRVRSLIANSKQ